MKLVSYFASFLRIEDGVDWQTFREQKSYVRVGGSSFSVFSQLEGERVTFLRLFNAPMYQRIFAIDSTTIGAAPLCMANIYSANKGKHQKLTASHVYFVRFPLDVDIYVFRKMILNEQILRLNENGKYSMANESFFFLACRPIDDDITGSHPSSLYELLFDARLFFSSVR